jgi:hypothetical protein
LQLKSNKKQPKAVAMYVNEKHLAVMHAALSAYYRLRAGQFDIAMQCVSMPYDDHARFSSLAKLYSDVFFPGERSVYGVGHARIGDGNLAYETYKVIEQYMAVDRAGGFWSQSTNSFDDPLKVTDVPLARLPVRRYVDFNIPQKHAKRLTTLVNAKKWRELWDYVNVAMAGVPETHNVNLTKSAKILRPRGSKPWRLRIFKPEKLNSKNPEVPSVQ